MSILLSRVQPGEALPAFDFENLEEKGFRDFVEESTNEAQGEEHL